MNVKSYISRLLGMAGEPIITHPNAFRLPADVPMREPRKLHGANIAEISKAAERNLTVLEGTRELIEAEIARLDNELTLTNVCLKAERAKYNALGFSADSFHLELAGVDLDSLELMPDDYDPDKVDA